MVIMNSHEQKNIFLIFFPESWENFRDDGI